MKYQDKKDHIEISYIRHKEKVEEEDWREEISY